MFCCFSELESDAKMGFDEDQKDEQVEVLVKNRTVIRGKVTKLVKDLREYRSGDIDQDDLAYKIYVLEQTEKRLAETQTKLDCKGVADDTSHADSLQEELFKARRVLSRVENAPTPQMDSKGLKVSDVNLPIFSGDLHQWSEFWDLFKVAVHSNRRYVAVQKFSILKGHLSGKLVR